MPRKKSEFSSKFLWVEVGEVSWELQEVYCELPEPATQTDPAYNGLVEWLYLYPEVYGVYTTQLTDFTDFLNDDTIHAIEEKVIEHFRG